MNHPHKSQAAAMDRAGELPDGEQLRECVNSGQVSAAQVAAHAEAGELRLQGSPFESKMAMALHAAFFDGWGACRDAEFVGDEAANDAFNQSATLGLCLSIDQNPAPNHAAALAAKQEEVAKLREARNLASKHGWIGSEGDLIFTDLMLAGLIDEVRVVDAEPTRQYSNWAWQHVKSGGEYELLGNAKLQCDAPLADMAEVYVYQGEDGRMWARPITEFNARFKRVRPHPAPSQPALTDVQMDMVRRYSISKTNAEIRTMLGETAQPAAPVELPVVGALWEYIGNDPMGHRIQPCARALHEMNPDNPPYPDTWRLVDKVIKLSDAQAAIEFLQGVCKQHAAEKVEMGRRITELEAAGRKAS